MSEIKTSKTKRKADKIRKRMRELIRMGKLDLGVWTPEELSNRNVIKNYSWVIKKGKEG